MKAGSVQQEFGRQEIKVSRGGGGVTVMSAPACVSCMGTDGVLGAAAVTQMDGVSVSLFSSRIQFGQSPASLMRAAKNRIWNPFAFLNLRSRIQIVSCSCLTL